MIFSEQFYAINLFVYAYRKQHKYLIWTSDRINGYLMGVNDILIISKKYNLSILHYYMAKNLIDFLKYSINFWYKKIYIFRILNVYNHIEWNMVYKYKYNKYVKKKKFFLRLLF